MTEHRFDFAIDPDRGPCHVGQLRDYLDGSRSPGTTPLYLRTDAGGPVWGDGTLDTSDLPTIGALAAWLPNHDAYDTVYAVERDTGSGWAVVLDETYELGGYKGLVLVLAEERA